MTNAQFYPFIDSGGYTNRSHWSEDGWAWREANNRTKPTYWDDPVFNADKQPVVGVSWYEAMAYADWLSKRTGKTFKLPSEIEWEKAARGTDTRFYPWGDTMPNSELANFSGIVGRTTSVGTYPSGASSYDVRDMAGNVWEWTRSDYRVYPLLEVAVSKEITNPSQKFFVMRGGGWGSSPNSIRVSQRNRNTPEYLSSDLGFRLVHIP